MRGFWRIALVVAVAVVASAAAVVKLEATQPLNTSGCGSAGPSDPSYTVTSRPQPNPPSTPSSAVVVSVKRRGQPVNGATVCLSLDMVAMPMGVSKYLAHQISPGVYEDIVSFAMAATWIGTLVVAVEGKRVFSQSVTYHVT